MFKLNYNPHTTEICDAKLDFHFKPISKYTGEHSITMPFYSNCLFEAIKAKLADPKHVRLVFIRCSLNEVFCPHFLWTDGQYDYDFGVHHMLPSLFHVIWFQGTIRRYKKGFAIRYKNQLLAARKHKKST